MATQFFCKKHRTTKIKYISTVGSDGIPHHHYFCPECEKEKQHG